MLQRSRTSGGHPPLGVTFVELLVVLALLGLLTALTVPRLLEPQESPTEVSLRRFGGQLEAAAAIYHAHWIAAGRPAAATELEGFAGLPVNADGYPLGQQGLPQDRDSVTAEGCAFLAATLLRTAAPRLRVLSESAEATAAESELLVAASASECLFYDAAAEAVTAASGESPHVVYDSRNGRATYRAGIERRS